MCGIAGVVATDRDSAERGVRALLCRMVHRGPDDEGVEVLNAGGPTLALGQRRLAIIDVSPAGHQPMVHPETGDVLTYNGEIYNYLEFRRALEAEGVRFRGHSDTEVMLHAFVRWGPRAILEKAAGMYAVAFFERKTNRLLLARDPMGIKPLFYVRSGRGFAFSSEIRPLLAAGYLSPEINPSGMATALAYGAVQRPATFFSGIHWFTPGCHQWLTIEPDGRLREGPLERHWDYPAIDERMDEDEAVERVRTTLDLAVKEHMIADVPVGVFLSSGLDSTIMAGLALRHTDRLRTFTVGFADAPDLSESGLAGQTAAKFGVEHRDIQITGDQALAETERWIDSLDQPSVDGLNSYVISKAVRAAGIVVALSGLGGDELFGGYSSFVDVPRFEAALGRLAWAPAGLRAWLLGLAASRQSETVKQKVREMAHLGPDPLALYLHRRRLMSNRRLHALGLDATKLGLHPAFITHESAERAMAHGAADTVAAVSRWESKFYMRNMLLLDSDTNGMAHSLEIRVPMLDLRMLNLAHSIPGRVRLPSPRVANKHLLRVAFANILSEPLLKQKKKGFTLPIRRWMAGPMRDMCESSVSSVERSGLVEGREVRAVWDAFLREPETQVWSTAFMLVVLGRYMQRMRAIAAEAPSHAGEASRV